MPAANKKLRVSRGDIDGGDVNNECHKNQTDLQPNDRHIMPNPRVKVILWGHFYVEHPDAKNTAADLIGTIVSGPYMNNLVQYGVGRGTFEDVTVIDVDRSPAPATLSSSEAQDQLIEWLQTETVAPPPVVNERNLLYLIVPPTSTVLTPADENFGGYHSHGKFNAESDNDDLFWAIIRTNNPPSSGDQQIRNHAAIISHEMTEAFTDRDGNGWRSSNGCEISDHCETFGSTSGNVTTFSYQGFRVERYWSNWHHTCIQGDDPVRLSRFLKAVSPIGVPLPGVKWTGMSQIGLDTIAQKMRH
jgi:hypothetical protein